MSRRLEQVRWPAMVRWILERMFLRQLLLLEFEPVVLHRHPRSVSCPCVYPPWPLNLTVIDSMNRIGRNVRPFRMRYTEEKNTRPSQFMLPPAGQRRKAGGL